MLLDQLDVVEVRNNFIFFFLLLPNAMTHNGLHLLIQGYGLQVLIIITHDVYRV